jgi:hypothetical protein
MKPLSFACLTLVFAIRGWGAVDLHPTVPEAVGVNIHFVDPQPGEMKMLVASGVRWVRMDFKWSEIEIVKGQYDFSGWDRLVAVLEPHKIRAIFILDYRNKFYDNSQSPHTDEGIQAFARWTAAGAAHFKGRGILWEMYNEPNGSAWVPFVRGSTAPYIKLALAASKAIEQAAPGETIIGPALASVDRGWLEFCFKGGLLDYWSGVSVHPYRGTAPEAASGDFQALSTLIAHYSKGKTIPIIISECGYSTNAQGQASAVAWGGQTEETQGKFLARQWLSSLASGIPLTIWYDWRDDGPDPNNYEHHMGIVRYPYDGAHDPVYTPKPAYYAAQTLTTVLNGYRFNKRLNVGTSDDYALVFSGGDAVRFVVWTTAPAPHPVAIPARPGRFLVTGHTGEKLPPLTAGKDGLKVLATDAPQYLEAEK